MDDLLYLAIIVAFFLAASLYVRGCERLRGSQGDE
jgi:hypothetical protein